MRTSVFITVDTEVWPHSGNWGSALGPDMRRDIFGVTARGEYGLRHQLRTLDSFGLKAVFFVESLFATVVGRDRLAEIVEVVRAHGHDVQLHLHAEWLEWMGKSALPAHKGRYLKDYTEDEQAAMIEEGLANLRGCGADPVCAFRAGNYGADFNTLKALRRCGIRYDSSYNPCYLQSQCGMAMPERLLQPREIDGVIEYPIASFEDRPGHHRHLQIVACSFGEMRNALIQARRQGWTSVVIVSHSFELLRNRKSPGRAVVPDWICVSRFEKLCRFLAAHPDDFRTAVFAELDGGLPAVPEKAAILRSNILRTAGRYAEQALRRVNGAIGGRRAPIPPNRVDERSMIDAFE